MQLVGTIQGVIKISIQTLVLSYHVSIATFGLIKTSRRPSNSDTRQVVKLQ